MSSRQDFRGAENMAPPRRLVAARGGFWTAVVVAAFRLVAPLRRVTRTAQTRPDDSLLSHRGSPVIG